jgi:hypothetical protein
MDFNFSTETITPDETDILTIGGTGAIELPTGGTSARPVTGLDNGAMRYNTDINNIESYINGSWSPMGSGTGTVSSVAVAGSTGLSVSGSPITSSGTITLTLGTELQGLSGLSATGLVVRTGAGTYSSRSIAGTASNIIVTNGTGVSGDPTVDLATAGTSGTYLYSTTDAFGRVTSGAVATGTGILAQTAAGAATTRTITGTSGTIVITDGSGTAGNPTVTLATIGTPVSNQFVKITTDTFGRTSATSAVVVGDLTPILDSTYVNVIGDTMTGNLVMSGVSTQITLPNPPVAGTDATNKNYVDAAIAGLSWKQAVRTATTVNGTLATSFANGQTIDGVTLATGNRILIKNQTTQSQNGIYVVQASGAPVRADDANTGPELVGASVLVDQGTTNADSGWVQTANAPITIGTTSITWVQFSGSGSYTAGTGLTLTGNQFSLTSPVLATLGGTGQTTYVVGDILFANTTTTLARLADIATGNVLRSGGVSVAPAWGKVTLTTDVAGVLPVANGGTGLSAAPANGQIDIGNGTGFTRALLTAGTAIGITNAAGSITINNTGVVSLAGTAGNITASAATGAVTVNLATAGTAGTYGQVTTDTFGRVTSGGPNTVANGGTGLTALGTSNQILGVNAAATGLEYKTLTAGTGISITPSAGVLTIAAANNGTVTSVGLSLPSIFTVTGSPVTTSGTLTGALNTQTANTVFSGPTTGGAAVPTFRAMVFNDISNALQLYRESPSSPTTPIASGANSVAVGSDSAATAANTYALGAGALANVANIHAFANGDFTNAGDCQTIKVMARNITTNATDTPLFIDGSTQRIVMPNNSAWTFTIKVAGRRTDVAGWAMYSFQGGITRDATAASTTLQGSSRTTIDESTTSFNCTVTADTTNGALQITVRGAAGQTIRWAASLEITQVTN